MVRTPVHVLTGFLGSGKTTVLNRLLDARGLGQAAVIVNEFGEIAIDHLLVEASDESLVELAGGCLCCEVRADLARTIADLLGRRDRGECLPFDRVVVETTGLADPAPILNLLATDPLLAERTRGGAVVTTVDTVNGHEAFDRFGESVKQAALADQLIITKSDLAPALLASLEERLRRLNPVAPVWHAVDGRLPSGAELFGLEAPDRLGFDFSDPTPGDLPAGDLPTGHTEGIETFTLRREAPISGAALALFVETLAEQLGADLLRLKGLVALAEAPDRPAVLQGAQHVFHPLDFLAKWPDADRGTRLVFIVQRRAPAGGWVADLLDAIEWEVRETEVGLGLG